MSTFDLSTLSTPELRRLLDSARQRGQAAQSLEILREMDARRSGLAQPIMAKGRRRAARRGSRTIELQLGDPLEKFEETLDDLPPMPDTEPPLTLEPIAAQAAPTPPPAKARQRWGHWATLCFALGLGGGVAAGWWAADGGSWQPMARPTLASARPPAARRPLPVVMSAPAAPALPAVPPATPETQLASAVDIPAAPVAAPPTPIEASPEVAAAPPPPTPVIDAHAATRPVAAKDPPVETAAADGKPACSGEPTPADAVICREPRLRRLQAELRTAYAEAMVAHRDRALLRQRQLAWRDGRNTVSSPDQLARLYSKRIEQLKAATAEAIRER